MAKNAERTLRLVKAEIIRKAWSGTLDRNPLLASSRRHPCQKCRAALNVRFLDYLSVGAFEFGRSETIETVYAAPTLIGLNRGQEQVTPVIIKVQCHGCGTENSLTPLSLEYLVHILQWTQNADFYA